MIPVPVVPVVPMTPHPVRHCSVCGQARSFELLPCADGHGADCPELVCVECGYVVVVAEAPAERAARRLSSCGYSDVRTVDGGMPAWARAGYGVFAGVNVPSKTLGELAEHAFHPATIDAPTLHAWKAEGRRFHFFDVRPPAEYGKMRIPGARCLPNGELAHPGTARQRAEIGHPPFGRRVARLDRDRA